MPWSGSPGTLESGTPGPPPLGFERDPSFCESKRTPKASSARMPLTITSKTPISTRRLKNADRVEQFFFMYFEGHEMADWLRLEFEVDLLSCERSHFLKTARKRFSLVTRNQNSSTTFCAKITKSPRRIFLVRVVAW